MARDRPTSFITYPLDRSQGRRTRLPVTSNDVHRASSHLISILALIQLSDRPLPPLSLRRAEFSFTTALAALPPRPTALVDVLVHPLTPQTTLLSIYPLPSCPRWLPSPLVNCPIELTRTTSTSPF